MSASRRSASPALFAVASAGGVVAFLYPFLLRGRAVAETSAHASDAPLLFALLGAIVLAIAISEVREGRMDARRVALLGVLAALNAALRLPGSLGGANLMFFLPIACGYTFGPGFGFMLGVSSMAASGVITGGVGPWLPFQMWALGWVGGGAGLIRPLGGSRPAGVRAVALLAAYGWLAGMVFGALTNLWFWPYASGAAEQISWRAGIGAAEALRRYWRFYLLTSLPWDSARALGNVVLAIVFGRPVLRLLDRFRRRFRPVAFVEIAPRRALEGGIG